MWKWNVGLCWFCAAELCSKQHPEREGLVCLCCFSSCWWNMGSVWPLLGFAIANRQHNAWISAGFTSVNPFGNHGVIESPELERTHEDNWSLTPGPAQGTSRIPHAPEILDSLYRKVTFSNLKASSSHISWCLHTTYLFHWVAKIRSVVKSSVLHQSSGEEMVQISVHKNSPVRREGWAWLLVWEGEHICSLNHPGEQCEECSL